MSDRYLQHTHQDCTLQLCPDGRLRIVLLCTTWWLLLITGGGPGRKYHKN
jgi:hypothetical protein